MSALHPAMAAHLDAVTQDAERLRDVWAADGVLEFPYATDDMTSRIEGVDALIAFFGGARRWASWDFQPVRTVADDERRLHVAEIHATAVTVQTGRPYVQDYVIWMTLDDTGASPSGGNTGTSPASEASPAVRRAACVREVPTQLPAVAGDGAPRARQLLQLPGGDTGLRPLPRKWPTTHDPLPIAL